ncbi:hypothetical protein SLS56_009097 [Neofusicoccum ribis]|uniref:Cytochrome P450 n=1 Tax=Neofusicoccum ribis TaxID=45134 RepID=A0ABR3SIT9_9PEZI
MKMWLACNKTLVPYLQKLPFGLGDWTDHGTLDWTWKDRLNGAQMHTKYGKLFAHATPGKLEIFTVDAAISDQVLTKKREFPKPFEVAQILDVYGPSLGSVDDENWARHRKITAGSFADKNNRLVWRESVRQAKQMAELAAREPATRSVTKDTLTLSIHVLTSAAFGIEYDFRSSSEEVIPEGHQRSYRQCLQAVLHDVLILLIISKFIYNLPLLPQKLADFRDASREFKQYMVESVEACKHAVALGTVKGSNLLVSLVEKNEEARSIIEAGGSTSGKGLKGLRDDELYGNLFVYSFGGHETTAHTLSYAIYLLAAFPNVQDWLVEELKAVSCDLSADAAFDEAFHQLKRCLAVMVS